MKNFKIILFVSIFVLSSLFAIGGFGLQLGQSMFSVAESSPPTGSQFVTLTNSSFENSFNFGGYLYIDAIPFIDLEVDGNISGNTYDINFINSFGNMDPIPFGWISSNIYYTLRKKVFGLSIPFLAGAKIHAGGGYNTHLTTPVADVDMVKKLLGGTDDALINGDVSGLNKNLEDFLTDKDNYIEASGLHIQVGFQFKLLILDTFLNYRYTIVEDVVPGASGFGSLNLRIGIGI